MQVIQICQKPAIQFHEQIKEDYMKIWKTIKIVTNDDNGTLPRRIQHKGRIITSAKEKANHCISFSIIDIKDIRAQFRISYLAPLMFLRFLILEVKQELNIHEMTVDETFKIIKDMKCSNTAGHDSISSRLIKIEIVICSKHECVRRGPQSCSHSLVLDPLPWVEE